MNNIIELGPHARMKPKEALDLTNRESPEEVLILFIDSDGDLGVRSSAMTNKDALWMLEVARRMLMSGLFPDD